MKRSIIITLAMGLLFIIELQIFAERDFHGDRHGDRGRGRGAVVVEPHRFSRNKVVVVKPRRVRTMRVLPRGYSTIAFSGRNYYYRGGLFYGLFGGAYTVIAAPIGIRVRILPVGYRRIFIGGAPYFYYSGVYYRPVDDGYETIEPTSGTIVPELPQDDVDKVTIDGQTYYEYDKILYKPIVTDNGLQYQVAGKLDK
ncbi:MAG: DUF6515 family protein [Paludibacteraceae bacterium]|nr:DUF6515 family protein [Paludibacteraceae bacterium]